VRCNIFYGFINFGKDVGPASDTTSVSRGKDMLVVVFELFAANCTNYMICARLWLFNKFWVFLISS